MGDFFYKLLNNNIDSSTLRWFKEFDAKSGKIENPSNKEGFISS